MARSLLVVLVMLSLASSLSASCNPPVKGLGATVAEGLHSLFGHRGQRLTARRIASGWASDSITGRP